MGLVVDRIIGAIKLSEKEVFPLPYIFQGTIFPAFTGYVKFGDDLFLLIDLGRLYEEFIAKS
jgi:chemotaxis signal transduction protein